MEGKRAEQRGDQWHDLREDRVKFSNSDNFSAKTKEMITWMLNSDPNKRPTIQQLLDKYLMSEQEKQFQLLKILWINLTKRWIELEKQNSLLLNNQ